jgi:hypothetical protein
VEQHGLDIDDKRLKSRKGSIPANVQTLMKEAEMAAFVDEVRKLSVDEHEVEQAAAKLQKPKPWKVIGQTAGLASVAAPVIDTAGKFTKGVVNTKGGIAPRIAGGIKEVGQHTVGDLAAKAVTSGLGGGVLAAAKEGIELHHARKAIHSYLAENKLSSLFGGPPSGPGTPKVTVPSAPTLGVLRGSSNKSQRVGNTPIAAKSGVTRSSSGDPMNPRRNLSDAMQAYKA